MFCALIQHYYFFFREETEIIEGEVVEIQIDRPATGTVSIKAIIKEINAHYINEFKEIIEIIYKK